MRGGRVERLDGTALLALADGSAPPAGSTAQIGVLDDTHLLVTLKADPTPGAVDVIALKDGAIAQTVADAVPGPEGSQAPFGFAVYPDGTALITLAHSQQDALFRNGEFAAVVDGGQAGPCWMTRAGKYVFVANTGSRTLSRLIGTGHNLFIDSEIEVAIPTGNPTDIDASGGALAAIDHGAGTSHLSFFTYNEFGELAVAGTSVDIGVADANGVALMPRAGLPRE
jgi:hypothetical protein